MTTLAHTDTDTHAGTAGTHAGTAGHPSEVATEIFQRLQRAWNAADGASFGAEFADQTDFVDVRGDHHHGDGAVIGRGHQAIFDSIYAGSTVEYHVDAARELAPGVLSAVVSATLDAPSGPLAGTNSSRITATLVRDGDRWVVTVFQNTLAVR